MSQVDVAIRNASKLSLKVSKSLNISQSPQLDEEMQDQVKELLLSFLQSTNIVHKIFQFSNDCIYLYAFSCFFSEGRRIAESSSKPIRRKRELIRSLLRKTVEELNKSLNEINGRWLEGYGHVQNEIMKPGLLTKQHFIDLFNEFVKNDLICEENKVDALSIKSVFLADGHNNRIRSIRRCKNRQDCSFRLSVK